MERDLHVAGNDDRARGSADRIQRDGERGRRIHVERRLEHDRARLEAGEADGKRRDRSEPATHDLPPTPRPLRARIASRASGMPRNSIPVRPQPPLLYAPAGGAPPLTSATAMEARYKGCPGVSISTCTSSGSCGSSSQLGVVGWCANTQHSWEIVCGESGQALSEREVELVGLDLAGRRQPTDREQLRAVEPVEGNGLPRLSQVDRGAHRRRCGGRAARARRSPRAPACSTGVEDRCRSRDPHAPAGGRLGRRSRGLLRRRSAPTQIPRAIPKANPAAIEITASALAPGVGPRPIGTSVRALSYHADGSRHSGFRGRAGFPGADGLGPELHSA